MGAIGFIRHVPVRASDATAIDSCKLITPRVPNEKYKATIKLAEYYLYFKGILTVTPVFGNDDYISCSLDTGQGRNPSPRKVSHIGFEIIENLFVAHNLIMRWIYDPFLRPINQSAPNR